MVVPVTGAAILPVGDVFPVPMRMGRADRVRAAAESRTANRAVHSAPAEAADTVRVPNVSDVAVEIAM